MYTKDLIIEKIRNFYTEYNKVPTSRDFQKLTGYPGATTVQRHFGSWNAAIAAAELEQNTASYLKILDKNSIIKLIQQYYARYIKIPTTRDFDSNPAYINSTTVINYFNSWNAAIEAAGFAVYKKELIYTDEELLSAITSFYIEYDRVPNNRDFISNPEYPSYTTIVNRFGSWNNAITKAGLATNTGCYGVVTKGLDGINYRSAAEAYFCNRYLYKKYDYIVEPAYPPPYSKKRYDWFIASLQLYIELDGGLRPLVTEQKQKINSILNRKCLFIPESIIYNKTDLDFFIK